ncbi:uncharacterized protein SPSK_10191 [Sporothrix schenckii 1099-18]|uniref:Uncharacterized protein n=1 Tax=Sporothrix schenckii 1099-18 TaxID=1397361 RepID=A0A0F2M5L8_SPOSC|nr:uncharacterized protein SPSK_10191 [Sporothrix schenckii 1099-18]KJR84404.1 hypothetical protein SPSK_10191 [Sporothrix schenckii 1099-18]
MQSRLVELVMQIPCCLFARCYVDKNVLPLILLIMMTARDAGAPNNGTASRFHRNRETVLSETKDIYPHDRETVLEAV